MAPNLSFGPKQNCRRWPKLDYHTVPLLKNRNKKTPNNFICHVVPLICCVTCSRRRLGRSAECSVDKGREVPLGQEDKLMIPLN